MKENKKPYIVTIAIICIGTGIVLGTGMFRLAGDDYKHNPLDLFFLISASILFWYSISYLFNQLLNILLWEKFIKIPVGVNSYQWIKDFIASLPYTISTGILLVDTFNLELNLLWITVLIIIQFIQTSIRPQLTTMFAGKSSSKTNPFNTGDWIKIRNDAGVELIIGKVCNICRGSVFIKTEDNNLVSVSSDLINRLLIENYRGGGEESRFQIKLTFDFHIPQKRIKRILHASVFQVFYEIKIPLVKEPDVIIESIIDNEIIYVINYWIKPWIDINPSFMKNKIYSVIINNLNYTGINSLVKENSSMGVNFDLNHIDNKKIILSKIALFENLNTNEITMLAEDLKLIEFRQNELIISESDSGHSMFILLEGLLEVYKHNNEGSDIKVGLLKPGDFFGEVSLLTGENRSASVKTVCNSVVYEITKNTIAPIIEKRTVLAESFAKVITERHEINIKRIQDSQIKHKSGLDFVVDKIKSFFHLKH